MTLDQLKILVAIADEGSVLAAAKSLYRTQPTISVLLRKLEDELDLVLLDRNNYRATLTPEGWQLYKKAKAILGQVDEFGRLARYLAVGHEPSLSLAVEASCPVPLILEVLQESERKYPETELNLEVENIWGALEKLERGDVDIAVSPIFKEDARFETMPLMTTHLLAVAAPGFLESAGPLPLDTMKNYVQIVVRDSAQKKANQSFGVLDNGRHWVVGDHMTKKQLIVAGMGWGKLQDSLIADELARGELILLDIENYPCDIPMEIMAVRLAGRQVGPVAAALWDDFSFSMGQRVAEVE